MFNQRINQLKQAIRTPKAARELTQCLHGIERETLRTRPDGKLALTPHPKGLGSALTHPKITTDYSEALLEFITGTHQSHTALLDELQNIHTYTAQQLDEELLWSASMPNLLPSEAQIPIAYYGRSNQAEMKHVYRRGLAMRYGKAMQCIAGIHYNFSFSEQFWFLLYPCLKDRVHAQSQGYVSLIRNFMRYSWLLLYCFGASPALHRAFLPQGSDSLNVLDPDTLFMPYATSLRMSDLGYQNDGQAHIRPCYHSLDDYILTLKQALSAPSPQYEKMGLYKDGERVQLNTHVLQLENEYYASIRPKRVTFAGERPLSALQNRGIQYVEVRCLDVNPFSPVGIDSSCTYFLDAFLWFCALESSPEFRDDGFCAQSKQNFLTVAKRGREPGLTLNHGQETVSLSDWGTELLEKIKACADILDRAHGGQAHVQAVSDQFQKILHPETTPSAQVLERIKASGGSYLAWTLEQSQDHTRHLQALPLIHADEWRDLAINSVAEQSRLESASQMPFEEFLAIYEHS